MGSGLSLLPVAPDSDAGEGWRRHALEMVGGSSVAPTMCLGV